MTHQVTIRNTGHRFPAQDGSSILQSALDEVEALVGAQELVERQVGCQGVSRLLLQQPTVPEGPYGEVRHGGSVAPREPGMRRQRHEQEPLRRAASLHLSLPLLKALVIHRGPGKALPEGRDELCFQLQRQLRVTATEVPNRRTDDLRCLARPVGRQEGPQELKGRPCTIYRILVELQGLADKALGARSRKVKDLLGSAERSQAGVESAVAQVSQISLLFVDSALLVKLEQDMRAQLQNYL